MLEIFIDVVSRFIYHYNLASSTSSSALVQDRALYLAAVGIFKRTRSQENIPLITRGGHVAFDCSQLGELFDVAYRRCRQVGK